MKRVQVKTEMMTETSITVTPAEGAPHAPHVKSDPGQGQGGLGWLRLNTDYFKTIPGILKLIQVVSIYPPKWGLFFFSFVLSGLHVNILVERVKNFSACGKRPTVPYPHPFLSCLLTGSADRVLKIDAGPCVSHCPALNQFGWETLELTDSVFISLWTCTQVSIPKRTELMSNLPNGAAPRWMAQGPVLIRITSNTQLHPRLRTY